MTTVSLLLGIVACEMGVRWAEVGLAKDVLRDHFGITAISSFYEPCRRHDDLRFWRPGQNFERTYPRLRLRLRTSALAVGGCVHGFRLNGWGDDFPAYGIVLGDSHTDNARLSDEELWVSVLSQTCGKRFVNLGRGGEGTRAHLQTAGFALPLFRPKTVILQLTDNDLEEFPSGQDAGPGFGEWKSVLRGVLEPLVERPKNGFLASSLTLFGTQQYLILPAAKRLLVSPYDREGAIKDPQVTGQLMGNVDRIHRLSREFGARLAVFAVMSPSVVQALGLRDWCAARNVLLLVADDLPWADYEAKHGPRRVLAVDPHYNAQATRFIGEELYKAFQTRGFLEPGG